MPGASLHPLLPGLKARVSALCQYGDRLYVGLATGQLQVYSFELPTDVEESNRGVPVVKLLKSHNVSRRSIDQIGFLPVTNQLVILTDSTITLHSIPDMNKKAIVSLSQARTAHCFEIASYTATLKKNSKNDPNDSEVESQVKRDMLVVGCRKKVVVYGTGKSGIKDGLELALAHSPRTVIIQSSGSSMPDTVHLLYSPTTSAILHIDTTSNPKQPLSVVDLPNNPLPQPTAGPSGTSKENGAGQAANQDGAGSGMGLGVGGALSGLGGYVGLGAKATLPVGTSTFGGEVLLARQELGGFYSSEGSFTRQDSIQWQAPPEALAFSNPYIYSVVPSITSSSATQPSSSINIHLGPTLLPRRSLSIPTPTAGSLTISSLVPVNGIEPGSPADALKASTKVLFCSTPTDKALLQSEGSSIWALKAGDVGEEVDELLREGRSMDAIGLVESVGESGLSPERRLPHLKTLDAVSQFAKGNYQPAIDTFLVFNVNPALVISLFPAETISGPLHVQRDKWMALFGAVEGARLESPTAPAKGASGDDAKSVLRLPHFGLSKKSSIDTLKETASVHSDGDKDKPAPPMSGDEVMAPRAALEALMYFLSDRRQKLAGAIASNGIPSESSFSPLSSLAASELHALPSIPMSELEPEQLLRMAQIIYTGLLKVYLVARPILVGSLCRIENWCDVHEVEGLLKAQKKYSDLIDLYQGKKMHDKALTMLEELAKEEDDPLDRYPPIIRYLQKLGPDHLKTIFDFSKWIFAEDPKRGLGIFTADEPEVEALPRQEVVTFLEKTNKEACIGYLEHLTGDLKDTSAEFHDKLAELYFEKARTDEKIRAKLLELLNTSQHYRANRLLGKLKGDEMPEMKAILLGRMGRHDEALRIYVYRLEDYTSAETYCSRIYSATSEIQDRSIFLLLLKIYLLPQKEQSLLLAPALSLLANHSTQLDPAAVLEFLPPLVTMQEVRSFFIRTLRDGTRRVHERKVMKSLISARKEEVERVVMGLEVKRVRITDQRICPQCHKRLGQSAIAVHAPRGEVTHLHCKDPFSATLAKLRT